MQCLPEVDERSGKGQPRRVAHNKTPTTSIHSSNVGRRRKVTRSRRHQSVNKQLQHLPREQEEIGIEQLRERAHLGTQDSNQGCFQRGVMESVEGEGKRQFRQLPWRWRTRGIRSVSPTANYSIHHRGSDNVHWLSTRGQGVCALLRDGSHYCLLLYVSLCYSQSAVCLALSGLVL
jgi:hypothetical protein